MRFSRPDVGVSLFAHESMDKALVEVSGRGCHYLAQHTDILAVLRVLLNNLTRLDVAVDIVTPCDPQDFITTRGETRHVTTAFIDSRTGRTAYVGSQHSDRYVRVYRYADPLPRSDMLRVEFVFRRELARAEAATIVAHGLLESARYFGECFAFQHPCWVLGASTADIAKQRGLGHRQANSVLWLVTQVFPAIRRMAREGILCDPHCFIDHYLWEVGDCATDCILPEDRAVLRSRLGDDDRDGSSGTLKNCGG
jgi:DNA relaxase NicK